MHENELKNTDTYREERREGRDSICFLSANTADRRLPDQRVENHVVQLNVFLCSLLLCCSTARNCVAARWNYISLNAPSLLSSPHLWCHHLSLFSCFHLSSITSCCQGIGNIHHPRIIKQSVNMMHCLCSTNFTVKTMRRASVLMCFEFISCSG